MGELSTEHSLLRAICADPADDTLRLAFADWCDEHGDPLRAEFIKVQMRLWELESEFHLNEPPHAKEIGKLLRREVEILNLLPTWRSVWKSALLDGSVLWNLKRGFIYTISLDRWHLFQTALIQEAFSQHPLESIQLLPGTTHPRNVSDSLGAGWTWRKVGGAYSTLYHAIPVALWQHLKGYLPEPWTKGYKRWENREEAVRALEEAALDYGRELAGLPVIQKGGVNDA